MSVIAAPEKWDDHGRNRNLWRKTRGGADAVILTETKTRSACLSLKSWRTVDGQGGFVSVSGGPDDIFPVQRNRTRNAFKGKGNGGFQMNRFHNRLTEVWFFFALIAVGAGATWPVASCAIALPVVYFHTGELNHCWKVDPPSAGTCADLPERYLMQFCARETWHEAAERFRDALPEDAHDETRAMLDRLETDPHGPPDEDIRDILIAFAAIGKEEDLDVIYRAYMMINKDEQ